MASRKKVIAKFLAILLSAFLIACAFPLPPVLKSMEGASAAWLGLIPLIIVIRLSNAKSAFWWGWLCGFISWLVSLAWVLQLRNSWAASPVLVLPVVALAWIALAAYCAFYTGLFAFLLAKIFPVGERGNDIVGHASRIRERVAGKTEPCVKTTGSLNTGKPVLQVCDGERVAPLLLAPVLWVGCEYLRGVMFTGFPWNSLGVSQYCNIYAIQIASWGGVYAVSAVIVLLNAALAFTALRIVYEVRHRVKGRRIHYELMLGLTVVALCWSMGMSRVRGNYAASYKDPSVRIASIQPDISQEVKWSEQHRFDAYSALQQPTEQALLSNPQLIIWPETAIPDLLRDDPLAQRIVTDLVTNNVSLIVGSMDYDQPDENTILYYNSSFLIDSRGKIAGSYRKHHLVPFGEYLPFENQIPLIKKMAPLGFSCMPGKKNGLMKLTLKDNSFLFGVLICFEDIFPYLARRDVRDGARFLINQTNDAWFEHSAASKQHMANAVFRAVENKVPLVRCTNTGVTCFINRFGHIEKLLESGDGHYNFRGYSVSEIRVPDANMPLTLYTRFGDWMLAIPCAMVVAGLLGWMAVSGFIRRRRRITND